MIKDVNEIVIRKGVLPAVQLMHSAPWQIAVAALDTDAVKTGVHDIIGRRPKFYKRFQEVRRAIPLAVDGLEHRLYPTSTTCSTFGSSAL